jgi:hypothetical protein
VVALWNLGIEAAPVVGHDERVTQVALVESRQTVVSADRGGRILTGRSQSGSLMSGPLETGIDSINALVAWEDAAHVLAATGAGSRREGRRRRCSSWRII